jgi:hypothetical protein
MAAAFLRFLRQPNRPIAPRVRHGIWLSSLRLNVIAPIVTRVPTLNGTLPARVL